MKADGINKRVWGEDIWRDSRRTRMEGRDKIIF